jgi:hypothetical protein
MVGNAVTESNELVAGVIDEVGTGIVKDVPNVRNEFKSYMDYRKITSKSSPQYKLQMSEYMDTDSEGFRKYKGDYVVAMGSYYSRDIGTRFKIELESGKVFYAVLGDQKSDMHTDALHQHRNGNVVEFIVDVDNISSLCRTSGDMSNAEQAGLVGKIKSIEIVGHIDEQFDWEKADKINTYEQKKSIEERKETDNKIDITVDIGETDKVNSYDELSVESSGDSDSEDSSDNEEESNVIGEIYIEEVEDSLLDTDENIVDGEQS